MLDSVPLVATPYVNADEAILHVAFFCGLSGAEEIAPSGWPPIGAIFILRGQNGRQEKFEAKNQLKTEKS